MIPVIAITLELIFCLSIKKQMWKSWVTLVVLFCCKCKDWMQVEKIQNLSIWDPIVSVSSIKDNFDRTLATESSWGQKLLLEWIRIGFVVRWWDLSLPVLQKSQQASVIFSMYIYGYFIISDHFTLLIGNINRGKCRVIDSFILALWNSTTNILALYFS